MGRQFFFWIFVLLALSTFLESLQELPSNLPERLRGKEFVQEQKQDEQLDGVLASLDPADIARPPVTGSVSILPNGESLDEIQLRTLLGADANRSAFFSYRLFGVSEATASAMGIDKQHHFVNAYLEGFSPFVVDNVWLPLQIMARRKAYQLDKLQYGSEEIWQTSRQAFYFTRGDCEDHALALADWLIDMGEDARVALGKYQGGGHAWVVLIKDGQEFILEATQKRGTRNLRQYPLAASLPDYQPQYQFNRDRFWHNSGTTLTTQYRSTAWREKSHFVRTAQY